MSLSNQKCMAQLSLNDLHSNKYSQKLHYYPFAVNLEKCVGNWNTLGELSKRVGVLNETKGLNVHFFNMILAINQSRTLTGYISCKCECTFYSKKCN